MAKLSLKSGVVIGSRLRGEKTHVNYRRGNIPFVYRAENEL
jgi:hypothetical protein